MVFTEKGFVHISNNNNNNNNIDPCGLYTFLCGMYHSNTLATLSYLVWPHDGILINEIIELHNIIYNHTLVRVHSLAGLHTLSHTLIVVSVRNHRAI